MNLQEIIDDWFSGAPAVKIISSLEGLEETKTAANVIKSIVLFELGSTHEAIDLSANLYENIDKENLKDQALIAITYSWLLSFFSNYLNSLIIAKKGMELLSLLDKKDRAEIYVWEGILTTCRGFCNYFLGNTEISISLGKKGTEMAKSSNKQWFIAVSHYYLAWIYMLNRELDKANIALDISIEKFTSISNQTWVSFSLTIKGIIQSRSKKYTDAIDTLKESLSLADTYQNNWGINFASHMLTQVWIRNNQIEQAMTFFSNKITIYASNSNKYGLGVCYAKIAHLQRAAGNTKRGISYLEKRLQIQETYDHKFERVWTLERIANYYLELGDKKNAILFLDRGLEIEGIKTRKDLLSELLLSRGKAYLQFGNLDHALKDLGVAMYYLEEIGDTWTLGEVINAIGNINLYQGQVEIALTNFTQAEKIFEQTDIEISTKNRYADTLLSLGQIYLGISDFDKSLTYFLRTEKFYRDSGDIISHIEIQHYIIDYYVKKGDLEAARQHLTQIQQTARSIDQEQVHLYSEVSEALILKNSPRMSQKVVAQQIFRKIIDQDTIVYSITIKALISLGELLIAELKSFSEPEVMTEIQEITQVMLKIAYKNHNYSLMIEAYLLQFKLSLLEFKFDDAQEHLSKAQDLAMKNGLQSKFKKVQKQQVDFMEELNHWQNFARKNVPLVDRLNHVQIDNYLDHLSSAIPEINFEQKNTELR